MTDGSQGAGPEYSGPAHTGDVPSGPPIPPPAAPGGGSVAQGSPSRQQQQGGGASSSPPRRQRAARGPNRRLWAAVGVLAVAVVVVVVLLIAGVFSSGSNVTVIKAPATAQATEQAEAGLKAPGAAAVAGEAPFTLHYPKGWTRLSAAQLAKIQNAPAAGLVAEGGRALLLVRPKKPLTQSVATLSEQLTASLSKRFSDFKLISTGTTRTLAGPAWVYTFERTKAGLVQTEVVISTSKAAYEIDIALHAGANRAAGEIGEIIHSFQT